MADFCHILTMSKNGANELANRWFQPLTHVSGRPFPRDTATCRQQGKREKREGQRFLVAQSAAQFVPGVFA
jgi:hypothetical protein